MIASQLRAGSPGSRRILSLIRASQRPDTAIAISQRIADSYALEVIRDEMARRFGPVTHENADAAIAWQTAALRELDRTVSR